MYRDNNAWSWLVTWLPDFLKVLATESEQKVKSKKVGYTELSAQVILVSFLSLNGLIVLPRARNGRKAKHIGELIISFNKNYGLIICVVALFNSGWMNG